MQHKKYQFRVLTANTDSKTSDRGWHVYLN